MAKKLGKLAIFSALAGAAAAGTYYYLQKKAKTPEDDYDDFDDFDDFDEDLENEDFSSGPVNTTGSRSRSHIPLDIDNAKEVIGEKVIEKLDKTKEKLEHFNVSEKIDKAKEFIGGMTSPASEPVYTQVDMSAQADTPAQADTSAQTDTSAQADTPSQEDAVSTETASDTDAAPTQAKNTTEEFFDDSDK